MQGELDTLKVAVAEKSELIDRQAERIADLETELALYQTQFKQAGRKTPVYTRPPAAHKLTGEQKAALRVALLDAYTTREAWEGLLQDVNHPLDLVALGNNLETIARRVLDQAEANGWLTHLMREAAEQRTQLKALDDLVNNLLKTLEP